MGTDVEMINCELFSQIIALWTDHEDEDDDDDDGQVQWSSTKWNLLRHRHKLKKSNRKEKLKN